MGPRNYVLDGGPELPTERGTCVGDVYLAPLARRTCLILASRTWTGRNKYHTAGASRDLLSNYFGHLFIFTACEAHEFACDNGYCISIEDRCNNFDNCGDDSDERGCTYPPRMFCVLSAGFEVGR